LVCQCKAQIHCYLHCTIFGKTNANRFYVFFVFFTQHKCRLVFYCIVPRSILTDEYGLPEGLTLELERFFSLGSVCLTLFTSWGSSRFTPILLYSFCKHSVLQYCTSDGNWHSLRVKKIHFVTTSPENLPQKNMVTSKRCLPTTLSTHLKLWRYHFSANISAKRQSLDETDWRRTLSRYLQHMCLRLDPALNFIPNKSARSH